MLQFHQKEETNCIHLLKIADSKGEITLQTFEFSVLLNTLKDRAFGKHLKTRICIENKSSNITRKH